MATETTPLPHTPPEGEIIRRLDSSLTPTYEISPADPMYGENPDHYLHVGRQALRAIRLAMIAARKETVERILDLPCGHGRVLRMLKTAFPEASLTACDIDRDGVDFCTRVLGATGVYSKEDPWEVDIDGSFDLIWCGSLFTHLGSSRWREFLSRFESLLEPKGLLLFTVSGRRVADRVRTRDLGSHPPDKRAVLGLLPAQAERLLEDYDREGFAYVDYPHVERYGISLASPAWVCAQLAQLPSLYLLSYREEWHVPPRGLDVVSCIRVA